jgi:fucose 4-O-acetylase-like acetyltransferase
MTTSTPTSSWPQDDAQAPAATTSSSPAKPRLLMIDIAKGLGILLIVLGHNPIFTHNLDGFADLLSSFRLPFFFFISGTMFSAAKRSVGVVALERADAWLKPVVVVILATAAIQIALSRMTPETVALQLLYPVGFTLAWTAMWFLPHLWLLYVAVTWLMRFKALSDTPLKRVLLVLALLCSGYLTLQLFDSGIENPACRRITEFSLDLFDCGLPFSADLLLITSAFFLMGYFLSAQVKEFRINLRFLLLALAVMSFCQIVFDIDIDFNYRSYENLVVCTAQAYSGIYIMLCLCSALTHFKKAAALLAYCGRASLFILIFHATFVLKIAERLPMYTSSKLVVGATAFFVPLAISILLWNICRRVELLSILMLPLKGRRRKEVKPA